MLGIVIVAYKNPEMTQRFVLEELPKVNYPFQAVIVNNSSTPQECEQLAQSYSEKLPPDLRSRVEILCSPENLGYARGNNLGVEYLLERYSGIDYWLFSNDDVLIQGNQVISTLLKELESNASYAAAGPRVTTLTGTEQSPHNSYVSPWRQIGWCLCPFLRGLKLFKLKKQVSTSNSEPQAYSTYWISGAFMVVKQKAFQEIAGFDPATFLYGEEVILAERLKKIHGQIRFVPQVQVIHLDGSSSKRTKSLNQYNMASMAHYYKKYKNISFLTIWLWETVLNLTSKTK